MTESKETIESISSADLRAKAKKLGIKFTKNTPDDTLIAKIEEIEGSSQRVQSRNVSTAKELLALKLVIVNPLNPLELNLPAKFITVANRYITVKKAVQFRKEIFLEQCVIDVLKEMQYLDVQSNCDKSGTKTPKPSTQLLPAYAITELHTPTEEEWKTDKKWKTMREVKARNDAAILEGTK